MDDGTLRDRLWQGFARLQTLLGGEAAGGVVVGGARDRRELRPGRARLADAQRRDRRRGRARPRPCWTRCASAGSSSACAAGASGPTARKLPRHRHAADRAHARDLLLAGHGAPRSTQLSLNGRAPARPTDLATVGHVNDLAYGNPDAPAGAHARPAPARPAARLRAPSSRAARRRSRSRCTTSEDCGISFVATAPHARRQGLASDVMQRVAIDARDAGLTSRDAAGDEPRREALPRARLPQGLRHAAVGAAPLTARAAARSTTSAGR